MADKKPFYSTVGMMMLIALAGKVMGLLRDRMFASYFGTYSVEGIAFNQASLLPRLFMDIMFAAVFSASFIPVFSGLLETKGKQAAFGLAARFITVVGLICVAVTVVLIAFAAPVYAVFLQGDYTGVEVAELGARLLRMLFPIMILSGLAFSFAGILQSMGQFNIPAAMSVVSNGVILGYYFFFIERFGVYGLAAAFLIGWGMQIFIQVPFLVKHGAWRGVKFRGFFKDEGLRQILRLTAPVLVATWVVPINLLVNNRASVDLYGGEHGVVALTLAHQLFTIITGLFVLALGNVLLPTLSKLAAVGDFKEFAAYVQKSLRGLLFLLVPMTFGLLAVARPLTRLVFQTGRFGAESTEITATALLYFAPGILGFGLFTILCRAFYAMKNGWPPLITGVAAIVINIFLSFALAPVLEIGGPALASSVAITFAAVALFIELRRTLRKQSRGLDIWTRHMNADFSKILVLSVIVFAAAHFSLEFTEGLFEEITVFAKTVTVIVPVFIGAAVYFAGCFILKVAEARQAVAFVFRKGKKSDG